MERINDLRNFLDNAHSVFHATALLVEKLENAGYKQLKEINEWTLIPGGKYYLTRNDSGDRLPGACGQAQGLPLQRQPHRPPLL